jgi:hypothetical protein
MNNFSNKKANRKDELEMHCDNEGVNKGQVSHFMEILLKNNSNALLENSLLHTYLIRLTNNYDNKMLLSNILSYFIRISKVEIKSSSKNYKKDKPEVKEKETVTNRSDDTRTKSRSKEKCNRGRKKFTFLNTKRKFRERDEPVTIPYLVPDPNPEPPRRSRSCYSCGSNSHMNINCCDHDRNRGIYLAKCCIVREISTNLLNSILKSGREDYETTEHFLSGEFATQGKRAMENAKEIIDTLILFKSQLSRRIHNPKLSLIDDRKITIRELQDIVKGLNIIEGDCSKLYTFIRKLFLIENDQKHFKLQYKKIYNFNLFDNL